MLASDPDEDDAEDGSPDSGGPSIGEHGDGDAGDGDRSGEATDEAAAGGEIQGDEQD